MTEKMVHIYGYRDCVKLLLSCQVNSHVLRISQCSGILYFKIAETLHQNIAIEHKPFRHFSNI